MGMEILIFLHKSEIAAKKKTINIIPALKTKDRPKAEYAKTPFNI